VDRNLRGVFADIYNNTRMAECGIVCEFTC
jgi:hypothetical protein